MQLTYRGVQYDYTPCGAEAAREASVFRALRPAYSLHYRGSVYTVDPNVEPRLAVAQPVGQLFYRGATYSLNGGASRVGATTAAAALSKPSLNRKASSNAEFAGVHRDNLYKNLQHRLEVAREKQDQNLISLLERELQQIA